MITRVRPSVFLKQLVLLYVEDEASIREPFLTLVERYFKKVYIATNGQEGVDIYTKHKEEIDIIISDIKMPEKYGLSMAEEIKNMDINIPIIFSTAFGDSEYMQRAIDIGADGYIVKPIDRNKLFSKLNFLANALVSQKESEQYMHLIEILFNYQKNGLILFDENCAIKLANQSFFNMFENENIKTLDDLLHKFKDENDNLLTKEMLISKKDIICKKDKLYFNLKLDVVENYLLLNISDVTSYYLQTEKIKDIAMKDELTGLYNRKKLDFILHEYMNKNICIIMFDIDDFKKVNDTYGHLKGDEVLKTLSKIVTENVRVSDFVIRWGGEEFIVVLQLDNPQIAKALADKLRIKISQQEIPEVGHITCSFGVSCGKIKDYNVNDILKQADDNLYKAKRKGKNRVEVN